MIKMNPKFRQKIKEEILNNITSEPIFQTDDRDLAVAINKGVDPTRLITSYMIANTNKFRLTPELAFMDGVLYYINDQTKEYYTIPQYEWYPRIMYIVKYRYIKEAIHKICISHVDSCILKNLKDIYPKLTESGFQESFLYLIKVKNTLINIVTATGKEFLLLEGYTTDSDIIYESPIKLMEGIATNIMYQSETYQGLLRNLENVSNELKDELLIMLHNNLAMLIFYYIVMDFYIDHHISTGQYRSLKDINENLRVIVKEIYFSAIHSVISEFDDIYTSDSNRLNEILSENEDQEMYLSVFETLKNSIRAIFKYSIIPCCTLKVANQQIGGLLNNVYERYNNEFKSYNKLYEILPITLFNKLYTSTNSLDLAENVFNNYAVDYDNMSVTDLTNSENYFNSTYSEMLASSKSDVYCVFKSEKYQNNIKDIYEFIMTAKECSLKDVSILKNSFKNISMMIPFYYLLGSNKSFKDYLNIKIRILDPESDEDEELFNQYFYLNKKFVSNQEDFRIQYEENYDMFHSRKDVYVVIQSGIETYLVGLSQMNMFGCYKILQDLQSNDQKILNKLYTIESQAYFESEVESFSMLFGTYPKNVVGFDNDYYKSSYNDVWDVMTCYYYIRELINYLNSKQHDGSIDIKLVEVEEITNKKHKSTSFTIHERKSSWVRAHYRHYKSGVVTLVTAHSRKGTNVTNDRLVLNL